MISYELIQKKIPILERKIKVVEITTNCVLTLSQTFWNLLIIGNMNKA